MTITYYVSYSAIQLSWTDSIITSAISVTPDPCGAFTHSIVDASSASLAAYSNIIPAFDTASATKTLDVATSDFADAQSYAFTLQVYYSNYPSNVHSKNFIIDIVDYCAPTSVSV